MNRIRRSSSDRLEEVRQRRGSIAAVTARRHAEQAIPGARTALLNRFSERTIDKAACQREAAERCVADRFDVHTASFFDVVASVVGALPMELLSFDDPGLVLQRC